MQVGRAGGPGRERGSFATVLRLAQTGELKALRIRNSWSTSVAASESYINEQFRMSCRHLTPP